MGIQAFEVKRLVLPRKLTYHFVQCEVKMSESELLKIAYFIGVEAALEEAQLSEMQKTAAMERIFITAEQLAKSKAAREAAKRAVKKPGFFARLFGGAAKDPAKMRARQQVLQGGLATDTPAYAKFRGRGAPLRYAPAISG
jgi:hypothetical protein